MRPIEPLSLLTVRDVLRLIPISRTRLYQEMRDGRLPTLSVGRRRLITPDAVREYIRLLESEARQLDGESYAPGSARESR